LIPVTAGQTIDGLTFHLGDTADWYVLKTPEALKQLGASHAAYLAKEMIAVTFTNSSANGQFDPAQHLFLFAAKDTDSGPALALQPVEFFSGVPDYYLLEVKNPLSALGGGTGPVPAAGVYAIHFHDNLGKAIDVPADVEDAFTVGSVNLANQPVVIPVGNFFGATTPASAVYPDFIAAVREDLTNQESVVYFYTGGASLAGFVVDANTPALKVPGLILSPTSAGNRRALFGTPGDYNHDGLDDLAIAITRLSRGSPVAQEAV